MPLVPTTLLATAEERSSTGKASLFEWCITLSRFPLANESTKSNLIDKIEEVIIATDFSREETALRSLQRLLREILDEEELTTKDFCDEVFKLQLCLAFYWPLDYNPETGEIVEPILLYGLSPDDTIIACSDGRLYEIEALQNQFSRISAYENVNGEICRKTPQNYYLNDRDIEHFFANGILVNVDDNVIRGKLEWARVMNALGENVGGQRLDELPDDEYTAVNAIRVSAMPLVRMLVSLLLSIGMIAMAIIMLNPGTLMSIASNWLSGAACVLAETNDKSLWNQFRNYAEGYMGAMCASAFSVIAVQVIVSSFYALNLMSLTTAVTVLTFAPNVLPLIPATIALLAYANRKDQDDNGVRDAFMKIMGMLFYPVVTLMAVIAISLEVIERFSSLVIRAGKSISLVATRIRDMFRGGSISQEELPSAQVTGNARMHEQLGRTQNINSIVSRLSEIVPAVISQVPTPPRVQTNTPGNSYSTSLSIPVRP